MLKNIGMERLNSNRLVLRKFNIADLQDFHELYNDEQFLIWTNHTPLSIEESKSILSHIIKSYYKNDNWHYYWAIHSKEHNKVIGIIKLHGFNNSNNSVSFDYAINSNYTSKGYMTEAFNLIIEFCFNKLKINRLEGVCSTKNLASKKVMEKVKMKQEGIIRDYIILHNEYHDCYMFSLLKKDRIN